MSNYSFIDLFAGIGGTRMGFESVGAKCVFSSEWDKYARITYTENFGDIPWGDIRFIDEKYIPDFDILVGGFPCQPFSIAGVSKNISLGRKHGLEHEKQGNLFFDIARILKEKNPSAFMLENVKNLIGHDKGKTFKVILGILQDLGYKVSYKVIDARYWVPQHRERTYIVGFDRNIVPSEFEFDFPVNPSNPPKLESILEETVDPKYTLTNNLWLYLQQYALKHKSRGNGFGFGIASKESHTRTLSARYYKDGSEILIEQAGKNPRRLTPRECAKLMGFPEEFKIPVSDMQAYKQFGNSIVVPVVKEIAARLINTLKKYERTYQKSYICSKR
jgi:DNA (cytosine-5)-methyltransferase 1